MFLWYFKGFKYTVWLATNYTKEYLFFKGGGIGPQLPHPTGN